MTVESTINRIAYVGTGALTPLPVSFPFPATTDLVVIETVVATGVETLKVLNTDYEVTGFPDTLQHYINGGTVTPLLTFPVTVTWTIYRDPEQIQGADLVENDNLPAESVEAEFDYVTMLIQRLSDRAGRSLHQPEGDAFAMSELPTALLRSSKYLAFDSSGNPEAVDAATASGTTVTATGSVNPRLLADHFADVVNVRNYDLTGGTDYTAAFTLAAAEGRDIFVPFGTFSTGSFTLDGVTMWGPGTLLWKAAAVAHWITLTNGASIDGPTFDGNASNQTSNTAIGIALSVSPKTRITDCKFTNFRYKIIQSDQGGSPDVRVAKNLFYDTGIITSANGLTIQSSRWTVTGNTFTGWNSDGHMIRTGMFGGGTTPVNGTTITGNTFYDHLNLGGAAITLEVYSYNTSITGNTFDTLLQAIKTEDAGNVVRRTTITGNTFSDISLVTALNLTASNGVFSGNELINVAGAIDIGNDWTVEDNDIDTVGDATHASINQSSGFTGAIVTNNRIKNAPFDGISLIGGECTVQGNRLKTIARRGINISAANSGDGDHTVTGNHINTCVDGIVIGSNVANSNFLGNMVRGASGNEYSYTKNANFLSNYFDAPSNRGYAGDLFTYTIDTGAISIGRSDIKIAVDTEAAAATDDLDTITLGNGYIGKIIVLRSVTAARVVTVKDGTNLKLAGDMVLNSTVDSLTLIYTGTNWEEMTRSNNA